MGHEFWYMHRHACSQRPALRLPGPVSGMQPAASGQGMRQTLRKNSQGKNAKTCQKYMYFSKKTD
jgi:hypothetical protein